MERLNEKIWRPFFISDLFHVKIGKAIDGNKVDRTSGNYLYVTRKESNNGVDGFIDYDESFLNKDVPCITVGNETAQPFVQTVPFFTGTKVNILSPKKELSYFTLMFIATSLRMHKSKYSYAFTINSTRLKNQKIMLPVNDDGAPDFVFMENYVRAVEGKLLQRYRDFAEEKLSALETKKIPPLNEKIWRPFFIKDLFVTIRNGLQVPTGAHVSKENLREGKTPRITVTSNNNGVCGFYSSTDKNYKTYENFISVSFLGDAFYHSYEASLDMKVHCLKLLDRELNEPLALFLMRMLKQMTAVFNYGNQISSTDIVNKKIQLPVNDEGAPDFEYMEAFVKNQEAEKYRKYLDYIG